MFAINNVRISNNAKLYVPFVTLSINDNIKWLEDIKQGFKWKISWIKYKSEITTQPKKSNWDYLIDPTFRNINRLFVLSFKNGNDDPTLNSFDKYYIPLVEIKDFKALVDNKPFFDQLVKNKQKTYKKTYRNVKKWWLHNRKILDFSYHQNYYKLIGRELSRQTSTSILQQINFTGELE